MEKDVYKESLIFWEILFKSFNLFIKNFKNIFLIWLTIYVPVKIIFFFLTGGFINSPFLSSDSFIAIIGVLGIIFEMSATVFVILLAKNHIDGGKNIFTKLLRKSFGKTLGATAVMFLYGVGIGIFSVLLLIPGLMFGVYCIFGMYAMVIKDIPLLKTFGYSKKLVEGRWWEIFIYAIFFIITVEALKYIIKYISYFDNIFLKYFAGGIMDFYGLFLVIILTLKFLNIDREVEKNEKENIVDLEL